MGQVIVCRRGGFSAHTYTQAHIHVYTHSGNMQECSGRMVNGGSGQGFKVRLTAAPLLQFRAGEITLSVPMMSAHDRLAAIPSTSVACAVRTNE